MFVSFDMQRNDESVIIRENQTQYVLFIAVVNNVLRARFGASCDAGFGGAQFRVTGLGRDAAHVKVELGEVHVAAVAPVFAPRVLDDPVFAIIVVVVPARHQHVVVKILGRREAPVVAVHSCNTTPVTRTSVDK